MNDRKKYLEFSSERIRKSRRAENLARVFGTFGAMGYGIMPELDRNLAVPGGRRQGR